MADPVPSGRGVSLRADPLGLGPGLWTGDRAPRVCGSGPPPRSATIRAQRVSEGAEHVHFASEGKIDEVPLPVPRGQANGALSSRIACLRFDGTLHRRPQSVAPRATTPWRDPVARSLPLSQRVALAWALCHRAMWSPAPSEWRTRAHPSGQEDRQSNPTTGARIVSLRPEWRRHG
jgi:hypothetical protein